MSISQRRWLYIYHFLYNHHPSGQLTQSYVISVIVLKSLCILYEFVLTPCTSSFPLALHVCTVLHNSSYEACMCVSVCGVVKCPDRPAGRGQVELCSSLLSTPLPLLALVCTLDCNSAPLVQLHFSSACERDWRRETGRKGKEMRQ